MSKCSIHNVALQQKKIVCYQISFHFLIPRTTKYPSLNVWLQIIKHNNLLIEWYTFTTNDTIVMKICKHWYVWCNFCYRKTAWKWQSQNAHLWTSTTNAHSTQMCNWNKKYKSKHISQAHITTETFYCSIKIYVIDSYLHQNMTQIICLVPTENIFCKKKKFLIKTYCCFFHGIQINHSRLSNTDSQKISFELYSK